MNLNVCNIGDCIVHLDGLYHKVVMITHSERQHEIQEEPIPSA